LQRDRESVASRGTIEPINFNKEEDQKYERNRHIIEEEDDEDRKQDRDEKDLKNNNKHFECCIII